MHPWSDTNARQSSHESQAVHRAHRRSIRRRWRRMTRSRVLLGANRRLAARLFSVSANRLTAVTSAARSASARCLFTKWFMRACRRRLFSGACSTGRLRQAGGRVPARMQGGGPRGRGLPWSCGQHRCNCPAAVSLLYAGYFLRHVGEEQVIDQLTLPEALLLRPSIAGLAEAPCAGLLSQSEAVPGKWPSQRPSLRRCLQPQGRCQFGAMRMR